jgi:subtilisin family serine protease
MLKKHLALALAALLTVWTAIEVAVPTWSPAAMADDDDDDDRDGDRDDDDDDDDDRRPPRAQRPEILAEGLSPPDFDRLLIRGFVVLHTRRVNLFGTELARLRAPPHVGRRQALALARRLAPNGRFSGNDLYHRFVHSVYRPTGGACGTRCEAFEITAWTQSLGKCATGASIGVVDTGVDLGHPSLAGAKVLVRTVRGPGHPPSDASHGTAVVSLLVGNPQSEVVGIVPGARVLVADVFHGHGRGSSADAYDLVAALDWLVSERAKVVNLSLSGPHNEHLQRAIAGAQEQDMHLIAAAGQPDRAGASGYPARYPGVIAVSAIDHRLRPSRRAIRGAHIAFTAPGAGIAVARPPSGVARVDGTSFAAPFVSAAYAIGLARGHTAATVTELLTQSAKDLGAPGRDPIYGWGLLQFSGLPSC